MPLGLKRGTVQLNQYSDQWQKLFDIEKNEIQNVFGDQALAIEHIGSTAIPGMVAKPILDLMVAVESIDNYETFTLLLEQLGYTFMHDFRDTQEHILYVKGPEECRTHYLKLTTVDSGFWKEHILFRDYLIANPQRAQQYIDLKQELLEKYADERSKYTEAKAAFILETLKLTENE